MIQSPSKLITLKEFLKLTETKPASEYIDGQIIQKPMPQGKHSTIQTEFSTTINIALKPQKIARAFSELRCTFGDIAPQGQAQRSTVPDVSVFTWQKIPRDQNGQVANTFSTAPDWTIKILSPHQIQTKFTKNILHCLNHGTQMSWLISPMKVSTLKQIT